MTSGPDELSSFRLNWNSSRKFTVADNSAASMSSRALTEKMSSADANRTIFFLLSSLRRSRREHLRMRDFALRFGVLVTGLFFGSTAGVLCFRIGLGSFSGFGQTAAVATNSFTVFVGTCLKSVLRQTCSIDCTNQSVSPEEHEKED